jgi:hypothetical protein
MERGGDRFSHAERHLTQSSSLPGTMAGCPQGMPLRRLLGCPCLLHSAELIANSDCQAPPAPAARSEIGSRNCCCGSGLGNVECDEQIFVEFEPRRVVGVDVGDEPFILAGLDAS